MDILSLLEKQKLKIKDIIELINGKQFDVLYSKYQKVIEELLFITSKQEFDDFIKENECLEIKSFLLAYACYENICCSIGMYETDAGVTLRRYLNLDEKIVLHDNYENPDYTYCEGVYYIFKIDIDSDNGTYVDQQIERII